MKAELTEGKLYVYPQTNEELKALAQFGADTSPETLASQLVLCVPNVVVSPGKATAAAPEAPSTEAPQVDEREGLLAKCQELGIEVKSGTRTNTLKKLIEAKEKEAAAPAEEPKAEAPKSSPESMISQADLLEISKRHISCFKEPSFQKVLQAFGAEKLSDVTADQYSTFVDALAAEAKAIKEEKECPEDSLLS